MRDVLADAKARLQSFLKARASSAFPRLKDVSGLRGVALGQCESGSGQVGSFHEGSDGCLHVASSA